MHHSRSDVSDHAQAGCLVGGTYANHHKIVDETDDEYTRVEQEDPVPADEPDHFTGQLQISLAVLVSLVIFLANDFSRVYEEGATSKVEAR